MTSLQSDDASLTPTALYLETDEDLSSSSIQTNEVLPAEPTATTAASEDRSSELNASSAANNLTSSTDSAAGIPYTPITSGGVSTTRNEQVPVAEHAAHEILFTQESPAPLNANLQRSPGAAAPSHMQDILQRLTQQFNLPPGSQVQLMDRGNGVVQAHVLPSRVGNQPPRAATISAANLNGNTTPSHSGVAANIARAAAGRASIRLNSVNGRSMRRPVALNSRSGRRASASTNNQVRLPPLQPTTLPDSQQSFRSNDRSDTDLESFKCGICYEYLATPSSCGQCSSRFCEYCLAKASPQANNNTNLCPTCRKPFTKIQLHGELVSQMQAVGTIPCRFAECSALLPLTQVQHHEKHDCKAVRVACRYANFGCPWKGSRQDVAHHESDECALQKVSSLVEQHRTLQDGFNRYRTDSATTIQGLTQMVVHQRDFVRRQAVVRSHKCLPDIFSFVMGVLTSPPRIWRTKDQWADMYNTAEARARVANVLAILPTFVFSLRLWLVEYYRSLAILSSPETSESLIVDATITLTAISLMWIVVIACFYGDAKSAMRWHFSRVVSLKKGRYITMPPLSWLVITLFAGFRLAFARMGGTVMPGTVFVLLMVSTAGLPMTVALVSGILARSQLTTGRALAPIVVALRYAFLFYMFDVTSSFVAITALSLLDGRWKIVSKLNGRTFFLADLPGGCYKCTAALLVLLETYYFWIGLNRTYHWHWACFFLLGTHVLTSIVLKSVQMLVFRMVRFGENGNKTIDAAAGLFVFALSVGCLFFLASV